MNKVPLGSQGLEVSRLALGCMGMSEFYGTADESESIATIHRAVDLGIDFIDTADMYGPFTNEILVGKAIRNHHNAIVLATKFGIQRGDKGDFLGICADRKYVKASCDASLRRLDVDHIDLYYLHRVDTRIPIEETVDAMARLVAQGKVRFIGLSEAAPETIRRGHAVHPITALQTEYSLWSRDPEEEILPVVRELGIGFVAYSPLGRGFLAGKIRTPEDFEEGDYRRGSPRFQGENFARNLQLVEKITGIAAEKGVKPGQLALAWLLTRGKEIVPLFGTKRRSYLEENAGAAAIELTDEDLETIDRAAPRGIAAGDRYPDMSTVNR